LAYEDNYNENRFEENEEGYDIDEEIENLSQRELNKQVLMLLRIDHLLILDLQSQIDRLKKSL
jgi:hypothetical protein